MAGSKRWLLFAKPEESDSWVGDFEAALRTNLLSLATTRTRHVGSDPNVERYDPDLWTDEFAFLSQPAQADDLSFERSDPEAYRRDVSNAEVHVLDAGHCALDTAADEITALVRRFLSSARPLLDEGVGDTFV